jgi:hypothetical protein
VEALVELVLRRPADHDRAVLVRNIHARRQLAGEGALGPLHGDDPSVERHVDTGGNGDGESADTGHQIYQM